MEAAFALIRFLVGLLLVPVVSGTLHSYSYQGPGDPVFDQQLATITVLDNYQLEFDIVLHSAPSNWNSIFQVGNEWGQRLPGVFYGPLNPQLQLVTSTNVNIWYDGVFTADLQMSRSYHVLMQLVDGVYRIELDGAQLFNENSRTLQPAANVGLWFCDAYYLDPCAPCTVSNLVYRTWDVLSPNTTTPMPVTTKAETTTISTPTTTSAPITTLPTTTLEATDSGNGSQNWALIVLVIAGGSVVVIAALVGGYYLCAEVDVGDAQITQLQRIASLSNAGANDTQTAEQCEEVVGVSQAVAGRSEDDERETVGSDDSAERREVNDAIYKVDKMERDAKDEGFGQELADLRVANALLEEDVVEDMGVVGETSGYESSDAGPVTDEGFAGEYEAGDSHVVETIR